MTDDAECTECAESNPAMSDDVRCDGCNKSGRRRRRFLAPKDWLYLEVTIDDEDEPGDSLVVYACSEECATGMWKKGPGPRMKLEETGD